MISKHTEPSCNISREKDVRFIAGALPDSELVILDGLKHSILIEAPERVAPPVRDFLLRHR